MLMVWAVVLAGCDLPTGTLNESDSAIHLASSASPDLATVLTDELDLSSTQATAVRAEFTRREHPEKNPGSLWFVSARLQDHLRDRQKEKLFHVAKRLREGHLRKLVGVYTPCAVKPSVDMEGPERIPIGVIVDMLSDRQLREAYEIRERVGAEIAAIRRQARAGELTRQEAARLVQQLHEALAEAIRALLTEEQIAALRDRINAAGNDSEQHFAAGRRAMIAALSLTDRQVTALDELHREQCSGLQRIVRLVNAGELSREEAHEGFDRLVMAKFDAYRGILDPAQFEIAAIHDALLIVNARRYIHHVADRG